MSSSTCYSYQLFDVTLVHELYRHQPQLSPGCYLSESWNGELDAIRSAVADGYRWVRTDGPLAVFEKATPVALQLDPLPSHIAAQAAQMAIVNG